MKSKKIENNFDNEEKKFTALRKSHELLKIIIKVVYYLWIILCNNFILIFFSYIINLLS